MTDAELLALKDGPAKKFHLIKRFAARLRELTDADPRTLSCAELIALLTAKEPERQ